MDESPSAPNRVVTIDLDDLDALNRRIAEKREVLRPLMEKVTPLIEQIKPLMKEVDAMVAARRVLLAPDYEWTGAGTKGAASARKPESRAQTHRSMVNMVLEDARRPLGVREILDAIEARFDVRLERTSISPLLRKLAAKGEVVHDPAGAKWKPGQRMAPSKKAGEVVEGRFSAGADEQEEKSDRSAA